MAQNTPAAQPRPAATVVVLRPEGDNLVLDGGVKTGDTVVTAGAHVLTPGEQVSLYVEPTKR